MTGNVVIPGMTTVGGDDLPIAGPALALAGFIGCQSLVRVPRNSRE
jgi:hypothetical protein